MSHVTSKQRYTIEVMLNQGYSQVEIARSIGKCKSVVCRERHRNCDQRSGEYRSDLADRKYKNRQQTKAKYIRFIPAVKKDVENKLAKQWSPEQISKTPCANNIKMVSHEGIYQHIIEDKKQGGQLYKQTRRKKKYRKRIGNKDRRGKIKNAVNISNRPAVVDNKSRVGDFEVDLVIGANHKGALITINERKTGFTIIKLVKTKGSKEVAQAIIKALTPIKDLCHTITSDNGKEFADHLLISKTLEIDFYFADPYSSWQRGANENYNGLLRQYYPKKTNFENLTWQQVKHVENLLNERPRKRLDFETPKNLFNFLTKVAFVA